MIYGEFVEGRGSISARIQDDNYKSFNPQFHLDIQHSRPFSVEDCPIVAVEVVGFSPDKVLRQVDNQASLYANTVDFCTVEKLIYNGSGSYPINEYPYVQNANVINYLVTDLYAQGYNGKDLFYQYELLYNIYSADLDSAVSVYKNSEFLVDKSSYSIQFTEDVLSSTTDRYSDTCWTSGVFEVNGTRRARLLLPLSFNDSSSYYTVSYTKSLYGAKIPTSELIELEPVYNADDFSITASGLVLSSASKIPTSTLSLSFIKDPYRRIVSNGIMEIKNEGYQTDAISSWKLQLSPGGFITRGDIFSVPSGIPYYLNSVYGSGEFPVVSRRAVLVSTDIIKVKDVPLYVDPTKYKWPLYLVDVYNKTDETLTDTTGKLSIDINGKSQTDLRVVSIDRHKGFIKFDREISNVGEIEVAYYVDGSRNMVLDNLELNPKVSSPPGGTGLHISGYYNGLGVAIRPYDSGNADTTFPYIYDPSTSEATRICTKLSDIGDATSTVDWASNFFSITEIYLNKLSPDILRITDARSIGGGVNLGKINDNVNLLKEKNWYTNIGYYDGEPLPHSSSIIIHIPRTMLDALKDKWIAKVAPDYENIYDGVTQSTRAFNFYLDQTIRRYISAGSNYILVPTEADGTFSSILNLE